MKLIDGTIIIAIVGVIASIISIFYIGNKKLYIKSQSSIFKIFLKYIPLVTVLVTILAYLTFNKKEESNLHLKNTFITKHENYIELKKQIRVDSISSFVLEFLKAEKTDSNILKYYAPRLSVYYQYKNVPVEYIIKNKKRFIKAYPKSKLIFEKAGIDVLLSNNDTVNVTASGLFYPDSLGQSKQILYKINIDWVNKKIFYIMNYIQAP